MNISHIINQKTDDYKRDCKKIDLIFFIDKLLIKNEVIIISGNAISIYRHTSLMDDLKTILLKKLVELNMQCNQYYFFL